LLDTAGTVADRWFRCCLRIRIRIGNQTSYIVSNRYGTEVGYNIFLVLSRTGGSEVTFLLVTDDTVAFTEQRMLQLLQSCRWIWRRCDSSCVGIVVFVGVGISAFVAMAMAIVIVVTIHLRMSYFWCRSEPHTDDHDP